MIEMEALSALITTHLWQSILIALVLAAILITGRRMSGSARYAVAGFALAASVAVPAAALLPCAALFEAAIRVFLPVQPEATASGVTAGLDGRLTIVAPAPAAHPSVDPAPVVVADAQPVPAKTASVAKPVAISLADMTPEDVHPAAATIDDAPTPTTPRMVQATPISAGLSFWNIPHINTGRLLSPLLVVWFMGALLMLARTTRDFLAAERLVREAQTVKLTGPMARRFAGIRITVSPEAPGPIAAGVLQPAIVLPPSVMDRLDSDEMAAMLEHERAHIERRDMLAALGQRMLLSLLWWSPAMHWISRRVDEEREVACDERAVARTGDARAFARTLTGEAQNRISAPTPRLVFGVLGKPSQFGRRIRRLIDSTRAGGGPARYAGRLAFSGLALAIVAAVFVTPRIVADTPHKSSPTPPPVDSGLDGATRPTRLVEAQEYATHPDDQLAGGDEDSDVDIDIDTSELESRLDELGEHISDLVERHINTAASNGELDGLAAEMAALGAEIGLMTSQQVLASMPEISEQVLAQLADQGVIVGDRDKWTFDYNGEKLTAEQFAERLKRDMPKISQGMRVQLTPQEREEVRRELEKGREEMRRALETMREELRNNSKLQEHSRTAQREAMEEARRAMEAARREMERAGATGQPLRIAVDPDHSATRDLIRAAEWGDTARVKQLIQDGAKVDRGVPGDGTPLIVAARRGRLEIVRMLLDAGADPNKSSPGDGNPLIMAAAYDRPEVARLLLKRGADANAFVPGDETPLINAAREGDLALVKLLVENGANVNCAYRAGSSVRTPLNQASALGHKSVTDYLRGKGATEAGETCRSK